MLSWTVVSWSSVVRKIACLTTQSCAGDVLKSLANWPSAGALWLFVPNSWLPVFHSQAVVVVAGSELNWAAASWSSIAGHRACLTCCPCLCLFKSMSLPLSLSSPTSCLCFRLLIQVELWILLNRSMCLDISDVSCFGSLPVFVSCLLMFQSCWYCWCVFLIL